MCGRPAGWRVLADRARLGRPGSRLPLRASVAGLGGAYRGGRPPAACLFMIVYVEDKHVVKLLRQNNYDGAKKLLKCFLSKKEGPLVLRIHLSVRFTPHVSSLASLLSVVLKQRSATVKCNELNSFDL